MILKYYNLFFFFKQKTAYEMRISDWSSDVCSSDLGTPRSNAQGGAVGVDAVDRTRGLRADLEWLVGDHAVTFGIDNITFEAENEGQDQLVDRWIYGRTTGSVVPGVIGSPASGANPDGYYVLKLLFRTSTSMELEQKACDIEAPDPAEIGRESGRGRGGTQG